MQRLAVLQAGKPFSAFTGTFFSHRLVGASSQSKSQSKFEVQTEKKNKIKGNLMYRNSLRYEDGPELRFATDF